jgi:hypothetical protein
MPSHLWFLRLPDAPSLKSSSFPTSITKIVYLPLTRRRALRLGATGTLPVRTLRIRAIGTLPVRMMNRLSRLRATGTLPVRTLRIRAIGTLPVRTLTMCRVEKLPLVCRVEKL